MDLRELVLRITPEMLDEAIAAGTGAAVMLRTVAAAAASKRFAAVVQAALDGANQTPMGSSPTHEHKLARTAILGGIQLGLVLAVEAQKRRTN